MLLNGPEKLSSPERKKRITDETPEMLKQLDKYEALHLHCPYGHFFRRA